jgi:hypothetical protein
LVNEQITRISHFPSVVSDEETNKSQFTSHGPKNSSPKLASTGPPTQVGLEAVIKAPVAEPFIKSEFPEKSLLPLGESSVLPKEDFVYLSPGLKSKDEKLRLVQNTLQNPANTSSTPIKIFTGSSETRPQKRARLDSGRKRDEKFGERVKRSRLIARKTLESDGEKASLPPRTSKTKRISNKNEILEYWRHFEREELAKISTSKTEKKAAHLVEHPSSIVEQLLSGPGGKGTDVQQRTVTVEDAHAIVSFVIAVAGPEALIQFKQALIGWRTQSMTTDLMQANGLASVLRALNHLETQNAFNSIATRIKLVQLADAVDVGHLTLPPSKGRGNPIVIWLSNQYRLFLRAEFPELQEGSTAWNTKLDDIKRKVKAGRRWQRLIKLFGIGIVGLVPSFAAADSQNSDFNRR